MTEFLLLGELFL